MAAKDFRVREPAGWGVLSRMIGPIDAGSCYNQEDSLMSKLSAEWRRTSVLEAVFDQLTDALVLYDPDFTVTGVNRAARIRR